MRNESRNIEKILAVKASAGSGKTTDLSKRIIHLLEATEGNILAVTFTNDAAQEMYNRVLDSLLQLVFEEDAIIPRLVRQNSSVPPAEYKKILLQILRSPQHLRITTIDSFFAQILQAIPIELELGSQYVIYDEEELALLKEDFIQEFCGYFLKNDIFNLLSSWQYFSVNKLFFQKWQKPTESNMMALFDYLQTLPFLPDRKKVEALLPPLLRDISHLQQRLIEEVQQFRTALEENLDDFGHVTNIQKYVLSRLENFSENPDISSVSAFKKESLENHQWFKKGVSRHPEINRLYCSARDTAGTLYHQVLEVKNILYHYYSYHYLNIWNNFLQEHNALSFDSIKMFIYSLTRQHLQSSTEEKSLFISDLFFHLDGNITHFLFDEFQDTDSFQWLFFWLLMEEILTQESEKSLYYVGDPKQSLYRFRGAVPELFDLVFQTLQQYHPSSKLLSLDYNYRSDASLLSFYNDFFSFWSTKKAQFQYEAQLKPGENLHNDCTLEQAKRPSKDLSSLEISIIPPLSQLEEAQNSEEDPFGFIVERIKLLTTRYNYSFHDIAILSYTKKELQQIGTLLKNADIGYVIDDNPSFITYRSYHIITAILSYLTLHSPQSLLKAYYYYFHHPEFENIPDAEASLAKDTLMLDSEEVMEAFQQAGLQDIEENLRTLEEMADNAPLDLLIRTIIRFFHLPPPLSSRQKHLAPRWEDEKLFLLDFLDFTHHYSQQRGYDLMRFLGYLEQHPERFTTISRISTNRVRLYTIHKSKGLQFPVVFYLYKPKDMRKPSSEPQFLYYYQEKNLQYLPPGHDVPLQRITGLKYPDEIHSLGKEHFPSSFFQGFDKKKKIDESIQENIHTEETFIEELNKCYVACTRAQKGLFVFYQKPTRSQKNIDLFTPFLAEKVPEDLEEAKDESAFKSWVIPHSLSPSKEKTALKETPSSEEKEAPSLNSYLTSITSAPEEQISYMGEDILSLGTLAHFLMQEAEYLQEKKQLDFQKAKKKVIRIWGHTLNRALLEEATKTVQYVARDRRLTELFESADTVLQEPHFIYQGKNHFIDSLFICRDKAVVVDYKVTRISLTSAQAEKELKNYFQQLQRYARICRSYPEYQDKRIETYLLNIFVQKQGYTWIPGPSENTAPGESHD